MHAVHDRVLRFIADARSATFEELALAVFTHQFECIPAYRRVCERRGRTPATVRDWRDIPPVPVLAFKRTALHCGPIERTFLTTGTTRGAQERGRHMLPDLRLYRASALAGLRRFVLPDVASMRILSLIPRASECPDSSLSQMVEWAVQELAASGSDWFAGAGAIRCEDLADALRHAERDGQPVCIMATTAALIRVLDDYTRRGWAFRLPHGSRLMDTGGDKGAPRRMSRHGLLHACWNAFAIPGYFCVNEYGMAELSSQYYDNVVCDRHAGRTTHRALAGPHWLRLRVLDPETLNDVAAGERGLLCHVDLANAGTAVTVLTEDLGRTTADGFELLGRVAGAEPRGCSLMAAEFEER